MNRIINNDYGDILAWGWLVSMPFFPVRLCDRELDEKERQEREDGGLEETDEYLEHHEGHGQEVRCEVHRDRDDYLARQDIAEEPERKRYHAHQLADELDDAYREADGVFEGILDEFAAVFPE